MKTHNILQGSDEWNQFRLTHYGASEASAMLGLSTKIKRNELLQMKHSGQAKEYSEWVEDVLFANGHAVEALARPILEEIIGDELYPVTCSDGDLSASCDGLTLDNTTAFEHKQWNESLAKHVTNKDLPDEYMAQCQQILMITGAKKLIFVTSDGTLDNHERMEIVQQEAWFNRIKSGWDQFVKDLADYVPRELTEKPQADAIKQLPTLSIQIKGEVIASNLPAFKAQAETFIANINTTLKTDDDFANAEANVKYCKETEESLEAAKKAAIAQTASIDEVMRTIDFIKDQLRTKRLDLDKKVKSEKANIKTKIINDAKLAFEDYLLTLEKEIIPLSLLVDHPHFDGAMKNKRTLESLHNAADTELATFKIRASETAGKLRANLNWFNLHTTITELPLFPDMQVIITKPMDDFKLLVNSRIETHKKQVEEAANKKAEEIKPVEAETTPATNQPKPTASITTITQKDDDNVTIPTADFHRLTGDSLMFQALLDAGVEEWDGFDDALRNYDEFVDELKNRLNTH